MTESSNVTRSASAIVDNSMSDPIDDDVDEAELDVAFEDLSKEVKDLKITKDTSLVSDKPAVDKENTASSQKSPAEATSSATSAATLPEEVWSEEYFKKMTEDLQQNMTSVLSGDSSQLDSLLEQMMNNVNVDLPDFEQNTDVDGQSIEEKLKATVDEITKGLSNLPINNIMRGAGDGEDSEEGGEGAANMLPFLEDIMQQFLSKDVLYPVFSETCAKYPAWLEKQKVPDDLTPEKHEKYSKQFKIMQKVVSEFDKETPADNPEVKKMRFNRILELLQEMQEYGSPPKDLVGEEGSPEMPTGTGAIEASGKTKWFWNKINNIVG